MTKGPLQASSRLVLLVVLAVSFLYVFRTIDRGWVPHDEGTLAEPAVRVLRGQLPHRDFDDMYTGGLTFFDAAVFKVAGTNLLVLRFALFLAFALWLPAVFLLAEHLSGRYAAAVVTLLAVAWSVPNYPAGMPSWYNLFLATWGVAALVRFEKTERLRWLLSAGFIGGLSILVKIVGLYYMAGVLLYLVYRVQTARPGCESGRPRAAPWESVFVTACLLLFSLSVVTLVAEHVTTEAVFYFILPPVFTAAFLVWTEWAHPPVDGAGDLRRILTTAATFVAGAALPILVFLVPYALGGGLEALYRGVLVLPRERFFMAWRNPAALRTTLAALPIAALAVAAVLLKGRTARVVAAAAAAVAVVLVLTGSHTPVYRAVWLGMRPLIALAVIGGLLTLRPTMGREDTERSRIVFLLVAVTAMQSLIQFPMSAPIYFFYVAPLLALSALGILTLARADYAIPLVLAAFYTLFTARWFNTGYVYQMGDYYAAHPPTVPLRLKRGGIRVVPQERDEVEALAAYVAAFAKSDYILALPDAPEVYFLTGKRNPTRTLFDFFDQGPGRTHRILADLDRDHVNLVVLNEGRTVFSGPPPRDLLDSLRARYPHVARSGRFIIRWHD